MAISKDNFADEGMHIVKLLLVLLSMHDVEDKSEFAAIMGTTIKAWCDMHKVNSSSFLTALTMSMLGAEKELSDSEDPPPYGIFNID